MTPTTVLKIEQLDVGYAGQAPIARRWSADIPAGVTLLFGDTGSGKSSLLRVLAGQQAAPGRLTLAGISLAADAAAYRHAVFFADPGDSAHDQRIAAEIVGNAGSAHADHFGLAPHLHKPLYMLSTGSRRKVWLAAALSSACPLVLLDEPGGALDAPSRAYLWRALANAHAREGRAIVVASSERPDGLSPVASFSLPLQGA